jgi:hypothetical protein
VLRRFLMDAADRYDFSERTNGRQRPQKQRIDQAEHSDRAADPERQRKDGDDAHHRALDQEAESEAEVVAETGHGAPTSGLYQRNRKRMAPPFGGAGQARRRRHSRDYGEEAAGAPAMSHGSHYR